MFGIRSPYTQDVALGYVSLPLRGVKTTRVKGPRAFNVASAINVASTTSAKGATYRSPGQRPGLKAHPEYQALKGRSNSARAKVILGIRSPYTQGVALGYVSLPLRGVKTTRVKGPPAFNVASAVNVASTTSAKGATYRSPGQRPGYNAHPEQLADEFGQGFGAKNLHRMMQFVEAFPNVQIVHALSTQLGWTHFKRIIPLKNDLRLDFYNRLKP